jgi:hypothetical protein
MNREVKQGKRSPSGTQSLGQVPRQRADAAFRLDGTVIVSAASFPLVNALLVGATGFEPVTSSVSGIRGAAWRPAANGRVCSVSWAVVCPVVTAVVRCDPVVRGPDVAPMWPRWSQSWKARPGSPFMPDAPPVPQVSPSRHRPLLTVRDRPLPVLRVRGGHGRNPGAASRVILC